MPWMVSHHADRRCPHKHPCGQKLTSSSGTISTMTTQLEPTLALDAAPPVRRASTVAKSGVWLGFIVVLAASVMDLLDSTIAQTAAPAIRADLSGSYTDIEWIY